MKFICGGQTGVDRAVLDACLKHNFPCGGWCPKGRLAEDGPIPDKYPLLEIQSSIYEDRTEKNVLESDATIIIFKDVIKGGTLYSREILKREGKPHIEFNLNSFEEAKIMRQILEFMHGKIVINVSGPRESEVPGIYEKVFELFADVIRNCK